jgi:pimeloyl-ACP methyl ester carboxylesterase
LDLIGPAILVTHSQSGLFGWIMADERPSLVKGIVALEPSGPPFHSGSDTQRKARNYGVTETPMTYDPPISSPDELLTVYQSQPDAEDLVACTLQQEPAKQLVNLKDIPIVIVAGEASYHAQYDHCTAKFLSQAGATVEFAPLGDHGIHGNGHMMMLEENNLEIAQFVNEWLGSNVR